MKTPIERLVTCDKCVSTEAGKYRMSVVQSVDLEKLLAVYDAAKAEVRFRSLDTELNLAGALFTIQLPCENRDK